jgi:hypothetical protein
MENRLKLFPLFEPFETGMLKVSDIHTIFMKFREIQTVNPL